MIEPRKHPRREIKYSGSWLPVARIVRIWCCQCGSHHKFQFRTRNGKMEIKCL